jgi:GNAT superfamily N-acetyltransferase
MERRRDGKLFQRLVGVGCNDEVGSLASGPNALRSSFMICPARTQDARALRMLLPQLRGGAAYFVAIGGQDQHVIGAAAMTQSCRIQPHSGPGVAIEVIAPHRGQGIATGLLTHLEDTARQSFDAQALYAATRVEEGSAAMQGWQWLGFEAIEKVEDHELPTAQFESELGPLVDRMRDKGRIPADARIIPLYEANAAAVLQLHLDQLGGDRRELYRKIRGQGAGAFHPRYSRVLLVSGRIKGCILAHRAAADVAAVDANILEPSIRGGWANVWLKLEATRGAVRLGIKTFRFTTFDHYSDTRRFTERLGGASTRTTYLMFRRIASRD